MKAKLKCAYLGDCYCTVKAKILARAPGGVFSECAKCPSYRPSLVRRASHKTRPLVKPDRTDFQKERNNHE